MNKPDTPAQGIPKLGQIGLERFAPYLMNRIMGRYNASLRDELAANGLTTVQMRALAVLSVNDGLMINELTVFAVSEQSTMSRTLDQMEKAGWIERRPDENDSRARRIFLTADGRALFDVLWPSMAGCEARMFDGVDDEERDEFIATLVKILRNIRKHPI
jgi:DNA-binding MarR family transcriptional regulator